MSDIYINCSDISSFIGQNKWDYWTSFIRLWKRVDSKAYAECEIMSKSTGKSIQNDKIIELKETLGENFINETLKKTTNKQEMINNINASHDIIEKLDVSAEKKTELKVNVESFVNTNFGTHNEIGALELYEMKYGKKNGILHYYIWLGNLNNELKKEYCKSFTKDEKEMNICLKIIDDTSKSAKIDLHIQDKSINKKLFSPLTLDPFEPLNLNFDE